MEMETKTIETEKEYKRQRSIEPKQLNISPSRCW